MKHEIIENTDGSVLFEIYETDEFIAERFLDGDYNVKFKPEARTKLKEIYKLLMEEV